MKINIVRQNALKFKRAQVIRRLNAVVSIGSLSFFALSILLVSGQYVYLSLRFNSLSAGVSTLRAAYDSRLEDVVSYLAVKQIVTAVSDIKGKRFGYKDFLNAVIRLLPVNAKLAEVSFGEAEVVMVGVRLDSLNDYDALLSNINSASTAPGFLFSAIAQKNLSRDKSGSYLASLELKIKK